MNDGILVSVRAEAFLAKISAAPEKFRQNMRRVVDRLSILVQTRTKEKLSGPVLHNRTGTLRRSINRVVLDDASGVVATVGTNVRYAAVHEYGFDGEVTVRAHVRKVASRSVGKGKKQTVQGIAFVQQHQRHMVLPERSFLRSSVRELAPQIRADIKAVALESLK